MKVRKDIKRAGFWRRVLDMWGLSFAMPCGAITATVGFAMIRGSDGFVRSPFIGFVSLFIGCYCLLYFFAMLLLKLRSNETLER